MNSRISIAVGAMLAALSLAALPASAHHGWSGQGDETFELTGTVHEAVSLAGPHATMQVMSEGQVWDITLAPPARTSRAGLTEDAIPVGAEVTITGKRNSDSDRYEVKTERVTYDGQNFDVYPNRVS